MIGLDRSGPSARRVGNAKTGLNVDNAINRVKTLLHLER